MNQTVKTILYLTIFSIAMGFMESAVVVYLRALYYPDGFAFPLVPLSKNILVTELLREAATLIMLLTTGIVAGRNFTERFVFFLYCFAIWDLFYYIFLYFLTGWPATLTEWDILFLLPVPWTGPVLAPCLLSVLMVVLMLLVAGLQLQRYKVKLSRVDWFLLISGSLVVIASFTQDYLEIIISGSRAQAGAGMMESLRTYIPASFNWLLFSAGFIILLAAIVNLAGRTIRAGKSGQ